MSTQPRIKLFPPHLCTSSITVINNIVCLKLCKHLVTAACNGRVCRRVCARAEWLTSNNGLSASEGQFPWIHMHLSTNTTFLWLKYTSLAVHTVLHHDHILSGHSSHPHLVPNLHFHCFSSFLTQTCATPTFNLSLYLVNSSPCLSICCLATHYTLLSSSLLVTQLGIHQLITHLFCS